MLRKNKFIIFNKIFNKKKKYENKIENYKHTW